MFLQLFLICFGLVCPFLNKLVAIGFGVVLCRFVACWLGVGFVQYFFLKM